MMNFMNITKLISILIVGLFTISLSGCSEKQPKIEARDVAKNVSTPSARKLSVPEPIILECDDLKDKLKRNLTYTELIQCTFVDLYKVTARMKLLENTILDNNEMADKNNTK